MESKSKFYRYVDGVLAGKEPVSKWVDLAVKRFITDTEKKDYVFDYKAGERVVNFCEKLCHHWKGLYAGKPIELLPHQHFYLINLFGWKREDGTRRFRRSFKMVARKNAKTTESAIKALYLVTKDDEHGAQVYAAATKEDQATIVVNDAGRIIEKSPHLKNRYELFKYKENIKRVVYPEMSAFIKPIGRDSTTQDGFDPHVGIIDEYHAHDDTGLVDVIQSGMGMRTQPLIDIISTAGFNLSGPCFDLQKVCEKILSGEITDDALMIMMHTLDNEEDWENEEEWIKPNPNMADPVLRDKIILPYLKQQVLEAKNEGATKEVAVKTKNFNVWCDAPEVWIGKEIWTKNTHGLDKSDLIGRPCYGGLDLASGTDINAFCLVFPKLRKISETAWIHGVLWWFWIPERKVIEKQDRVNYRQWEREGLIRVNSGNIIDHYQVTTDIIQAAQEYKIHSVAYDPKLAHHGVIQNLTEGGVVCNPFGQGIMSVSEPTKELEKLIMNYQFEHYGNQVIAWMISNTVPKRDPVGNIRIDKAASAEKIDGVAAMINAVAQCMQYGWNPQEQNDDAVITSW